ncbi:MAG: barstar family protein [Rhodocyclaceae bacterium]|nr:barstar family protein [Rhodocyclaceae bacterium]
MNATASTLRPLLAKGRLAGIYHLPHGDRQALADAARDLGFALLQTDLADVREAPAALERLGRDLCLPDWYGANYDALADCLTDLGWNEAPGYVLLVSGADELHAHDENALRTLNEVFAAVVDYWREADVPFWVLHDMRPDGLASLPTLAAG